MIPIEKNIIVVDENGTVFESTWLKRANGLVKKGRARWLDDRTICLACPPEKTEEHMMENMKQTEAVTEKITESAKRAESRPGGLTIESLLDRMDAVRKEMAGMQGLLATMENIANQAGDEDGGHIAEATSDAFVGLVLIVRSPASGAIHTYWYKSQKVNDYNFSSAEAAAASFPKLLSSDGDGLRSFLQNSESSSVDFCIDSPDNNYKNRRDIRISAYAANSSAVFTVAQDDDSDSKCPGRGL